MSDIVVVSPAKSFSNISARSSSGLLRSNLRQNTRFLQFSCDMGLLSVLRRIDILPRHIIASFGVNAISLQEPSITGLLPAITYCIDRNCKHDEVQADVKNKCGVHTVLQLRPEDYALDL